jgi:TolB-like protein/DNA-binding winged helix-turn-helix (wHTH) protein/Flp pilus assembly protein TadD
MANLTRYVLEDFALEPGSYTLLRGAAPVAISRMRFELLLYLIEQRHRVVARKELIERFWDGHEVYEENLTKCVSEVRKALDDQHKPHRFIETLPAIGYRFIGPVEVQEVQTSVDNTLEPAHSAESIVPVDLPVELVAEPRSAARGVRTWAVVAVLLISLAALAAAGTLYAYRVNAAARGVDSSPLHSLAVLPFKPLSEGNRDEFLELGMADALITKLSNIRQLTVTPTSAVRKYTNLSQNSIAAGNELGVESVLEGSLQKLSDRIRVNVRLVSVSDGSSLWAQTFDEKFADIFALQDSISERVAGALAVRLSTPERERITKRYTDSSEAYQLYQKGRFFWNKRTEEGLKKGIEFFEQAIKVDENYALAYSGLADSYLVANFNLRPPKEVFPKAKQAALKAIEIDGTLAEPHAALGITMMVYDRDWASAEREFRRSVSLNPNYGQGHQWYALSLAAAGRMAEAIAEAKRAQQAEPLSLAVNANVGWVMFLAHDYDQAIEQSSKVIEMDAGFGLAYLYRGLAYEQKGMFNKAIADLEIAKGSQSRPTVLGALGHAYAMAGNKQKAEAMLRSMEELSRTRYFPGFQLALIHIGLGEKDKAFDLLEKSYLDRYPALIHFNVEPRLDPIRSDPRFKVLLQRVGV